jgi:hypothetical protein
MSNTRHYSDAGLRKLAMELSENEKALLRMSGTLPKEPFCELHLSLRSSDVARMIELVENDEV